MNANKGRISDRSLYLILEPAKFNIRPGDGKAGRDRKYFCECLEVMEGDTGEEELEKFLKHVDKVK